MSKPRPHGPRASISGWRKHASCHGLDTELFFPETAADADAPKRVCAHCPVRTECLRWALAHDEPHGIWGGLTTAERHRLQLRDRYSTTILPAYGLAQGA